MDINTILSAVSTATTIAGFCIMMGTYKQKIKNLEDKVDKHNNVIERVFRLEENINHVDVGVLKEVTHRNSEDIKEIKEMIKEARS